MLSDSTLLRDDRSSAVLSDDREYRYRLTRRWNAGEPTVAFVMLNPSTADATEDDPTIRRCIGYAREWGYGRLVVGNLFAVRETDPANLYDYFDPVGPENDRYLQKIADEADKVVAAWGANGGLGDRAEHVAEDLGVDFYALGTTQEGHPVHPLYQPADAEPEPFAYDTDRSSSNQSDNLIQNQEAEQ